MRVGITVECAVCHCSKAPRGRSVPMRLGVGMCCSGLPNCSGYWIEPFPGSLWPGETEEEFGYPVPPEGTKEVA